MIMIRVLFAIAMLCVSVACTPSGATSAPDYSKELVVLEILHQYECEAGVERDRAYNTTAQDLWQEDVDRAKKSYWLSLKDWKKHSPDTEYPMVYEEPEFDEERYLQRQQYAYTAAKQTHVSWQSERATIGLLLDIAGAELPDLRCDPQP